MLAPMPFLVPMSRLGRVTALCAAAIVVLCKGKDCESEARLRQGNEP
jgi:hypothetical protein